jgi:hypothetical protein
MTCAADFAGLVEFSGVPPPEYRIFPGRYMTALPLSVASVVPATGVQLGASGSSR